MCLAIPMRVLSVDGTWAVVEASGAMLNVALDLVEGAEIGDYLLVHAGYAISRLTEEEAKENLMILERLAKEVP